jgi:hypothetical protein
MLVDHGADVNHQNNVGNTALILVVKKAGYTHDSARTGAVTLIQRFGSALNLNIHFLMLFLDGGIVISVGGLRRSEIGRKWKPCLKPTEIPGDGRLTTLNGPLEESNIQDRLKVITP